MTGGETDGVFKAIGEVRGFRGDEGFDDLAAAFVKELSGWGRRMHLTGRGEAERNLARQFADSLEMLVLAESLVQTGDRGAGPPCVADIGSGAGFPGLVWAIARPRWKMVLFERKKKLAAFLERTAAVLGLERVEVVPEELGDRGFEGRFGMAASKAAGRLERILPVAGRILTRDGIYVTVKGSGWEHELEGCEGPFEISGRRPIAGGGGEAVAFRKKRFT